MSPIVIDNPWECPELTEINRLPMRATLHPYPSLSSARQRNLADSDWVQSLNGAWAFRLFDRPEDVPPACLGTRMKDQTWDQIQVPGCWTMQGYDKPHYTNVQMPWKNEPPHVRATTNPTGVYRTAFTLSQAWCERRTVIQFGGMESCAIVYVNGQFVGLSKDTRLPAEFDLRPYVKAGRNVLAVMCIRYGDATYIEDQDHWWMAGIYRDVFLYSTASAFIEDVFAISTLDRADYRTGQLEVRVKLGFTAEPTENHTVEVRLYDGARAVLAAPLVATVRPSYHHDYYAGVLTARLPDVKAWSAETPRLYTVVVSLKDARHHVIEHTATRVGFRTYEVRNRQFLVNGQPVLIKGVCRHDHDPEHGKTMPRESLLADVRTMKQFNVNASRCSHYPNDPAWYDLCDEYGIYVLDEANIETHANYASFSHDPRWARAFFERITRMVLRDKNHACIFGWSLCNESGYGENHDRAADWVRQYDPHRILHNEGSLKMGWTQNSNRLEGSGDRANDFVGPMYPDVNTVREWARTTREDRPFIPCEYASGTGNAAGNLKEYWDLFHAEHGLQGGFIWQWINHGILCHASDGTPYWAYGGDFGDEPNDANFICNGYVFPDRTPKPALFELKKLVQPIRVDALDAERGAIRISNMDYFQSATWLRGDWTVEVEGQVRRKGVLPVLDIAPQTSLDVTVPLTHVEQKPGEEAFLTLRFTTQKKQLWCDAGHLVAWEQIRLPGARGARPLPTVRRGTPRVRETDSRATVSVGDIRLTVDTQRGVWSNLRVGKQLLARRGPEFNLWRGPLDNDAMKARWRSLAASNKIAAQWVAAGYRDLRPVLKESAITSTSTGITIRFKHHYLPGGNEPGFVHAHRYRITPAGVIRCDHVFSFAAGRVDPPRLGVRLNVPGELEDLTWFGPGPHETYCDRNQAAVGCYRGRVQDQYVPYAVPQENGNKDAARWFELRGADGTGLRVQASGAFGFSAHHFTPEDLEKAYHPYALKTHRDVTVLIDAMQRGVGSAACGPDTLDRYRSVPGTYKLSYAIFPVA